MADLVYNKSIPDYWHGLMAWREWFNGLGRWKGGVKILRKDAV
jgi:hypothetical protein